MHSQESNLTKIAVAVIISAILTGGGMIVGQKVALAAQQAGEAEHEKAQDEKFDRIEDQISDLVKSQQENARQIAVLLDRDNRDND